MRLLEYNAAVGHRVRVQLEAEWDSLFGLRKHLLDPRLVPAGDNPLGLEAADPEAMRSRSLERPVWHSPIGLL